MSEWAVVLVLWCVVSVAHGPPLGRFLSGTTGGVKVPPPANDRGR